MPQPIPAPIAPTDRISALDAARGFALLGIFCVNIQTFAGPFGNLIDPAPPAGIADSIAHYFIRIFCEGRFYPLFSAMFGIGLVLQRERIHDSGRSFAGLYARRLIVLGLMGLAHALLLWYGDILFVYAFAGAILLLCSGWSGKTLLRVGIGLVLFATLLTAVFSAISVPAPAEPALITSPSTGPTTDENAFFEGAGDAQPAPAAPDKFNDPFFHTPFGRLIKGFQTGTVQQPMDPIWVENETEAYRNGPYLQLFCFRAMTWLMILSISIVNFGWHVVGMFFIGAGLMKAGFFDPAAARMPRRALLLGLILGLPLAVGSALLPGLGITAPVMAAAGAMTTIGGTLLGLGYLGAVTIFVRSGRAAWLARSLARVGRMALTNYLSQTVIATTIFYYYGLGMFGDMSKAEQLVLVFVVYALQHLFSLFWLSIFAMGPMEWLWRTLTYLRPQPLLRR